MMVLEKSRKEWSEEEKGEREVGKKPKTKKK
jgi:hypothetical protein